MYTQNKSRGKKSQRREVIFNIVENFSRMKNERFASAKYINLHCIIINFYCIIIINILIFFRRILSPL